MSDKVEKYGLKWPKGTDPFLIEKWCIRKGEEWIKSQGRTLFFHYKEAQKLLWPNEDHHRWSDLILEEILKNDITVLAGAKDCVSGDTKLIDPITGIESTIKELSESNTQPTVMTLRGPVKASVPFLKGRSDLYEVGCSDGSKFKATLGHVVLSDSGFVRVESLQIGQSLFLYDVIHLESTSGSDPSIQKRDVLSFQKKAGGCQDDCFAYYRPCDGRLHSSEGIGQFFSPSPAGAQERKDSISLHLDGSDNKRSHNHPYQCGDHPSKQSVASPLLGFGNHESRRVLGETFSRISSLFQCGEQFHQESDPLGSFETQSLSSYGTRSSCEARSWETSLPFSLVRFGSLRFSYPSFSRLPPGLYASRIKRGASGFFLFCDPNSEASCNFKVSVKQVVSIKRLYKDDYYDIQVPGEHHYFAEGFIHHNSGKTHGMTKYGLTDYFCFPDETLIVVSSTDIRSLEGRVWGDMKSMFSEAKSLRDFLPGVVIDSKHAICTDDITDEDVVARDMRKGILCVPCKTSSGGQTNIAAYVGMKQKRRRYLADEMQFMSQSMYESLGNANSGNFKMVCAGNPIGQGDPLDLLSEPKGGWDTFPEPEKTTVWDNERFLRSRTISLVGTDSPCFDFDQSLPPRFPYLTNKDSIARTVAGYGLDSHQFYSQCKGVRRSGLNARRVITQEICRQFNAFDDLAWENDTIKIAAVDAAYGNLGGDRCVGGHIEFGKCVDGKIRLFVHPQEIVPVSVKNKSDSPEDQIAWWSRSYCERHNIPPENFFYDATGRGSLGPSLARIWSVAINPIEFGGAATTRPVSQDLFIDEIDKNTGQMKRRLKRCDEHYRKFVTELWWTARLVIESDQMRGLSQDLCREGCMREWKEVNGGKIEVESKAETKERMGKSPDLFDQLVTAIEGARRRGFQITKLGKETSKPKESHLQKLHQEHQSLLAGRQLANA